MDELLDTFKCQISAAVRNLERAGCFSNFEELDGGDRTFLDEVTKGPLAAVDWADVLFRLTEIVHILTKNRVIVLVDEYDTPTSDAVRHGYFSAVSPWLEMERDVVFYTAFCRQTPSSGASSRPC